MRTKHILLMLFAVALWGFNFPATRMVLEVFSPLQLAFARACMTLLVLLPLWRPFEPVPWRLMAAALAIGGFSFFLVYEAISLTESLTTVAVGTQLMPPMSAILSLLLFREHLSFRKWLGIAIATGGAIYLAGATKSSLSVTALGLTVLAVSFYSVGSIIIGKSTAVGIWQMLAWIAAVSLLPLGLMTAAAGPLFPDPHLLQWHHWLALVFSVLVAALFGQAVLFTLYRAYPVAAVIPWVLLIPVFAALSSIVLYHESISPSLVAGGSVILAGVWIQQHSASKRGRDTPVP